MQLGAGEEVGKHIVDSGSVLSPQVEIVLECDGVDLSEERRHSARASPLFAQHVDIAQIVNTEEDTAVTQGGPERAEGSKDGEELEPCHLRRFGVERCLLGGVQA